MPQGHFFLPDLLSAAIFWPLRKVRDFPPHPPQMERESLKTALQKKLSMAMYVVSYCIVKLNDTYFLNIFPKITKICYMQVPGMSFLILSVFFFYPDHFLALISLSYVLPSLFTTGH